MVKRIGLTQARRLALLGMRFEGHTALSVGVVHQIAHNEIELEQALRKPFSTLNEQHQRLRV